MPAEIRTVDPYVPQGTTIFEWIAEDDTVSADVYVQRGPVAYPLHSDISGSHCAPGVWLRRGVLYISDGFRFDGASGPAIDGVHNMLAAEIHDALYSLLRDGCRTFTRRQADQVYRDVMIAQRAGTARAWAHYLALRAFGGFSARAGKGK